MASEMMQAIEIKEFGGPAMLQICERPRPTLSPKKVLIKVAYAGVNRPDLLQRKGNYPVPEDANDLPGLEVSGQIIEIGNAVTNWKIGDSVCALCHGGGYAEYVAVDEGHAMAIPEGLDMAHAACLPETYITVWGNLFMRGNLKKAERVLIHGGASGIGTTAVQLARQMGAEIYATAGDDARCRYVETLGARACFNYKSENFEERLAAETNGEGVDVVLDMVAGGYLEAHIRTLKTDGRLVIIAVQGGIKDTLALNNVMRKRLTITGSTLRPQSNAAKSAIIVDMQSHIWGWLEAGHVAPIIQEVFDLKDAAKAHAALEAGQHIGKFVLYVADI